MPAQKRSSENLEEETQQRHHYQQQNHHHNQPQKEEPVDEDEDGGEDSDGSPSSSGGDKDEYVLVKLSDIRKEVQCPICLALYPDIDKYEEEELAFHEEEKNRNKQIQASIAQTFRRQSEALGRRRTTAKATAVAFARRSQGNYRNLRGRRSSRGPEIQGSDDDDDANGDGGKDSSSSDERLKPKRCRRWGGPRFSQPSSAAANADGVDENDDLEVSRESTGASPGRVGNPEVLAWGKGGVRSHTRYGSISGSNGKNARSRLSRLVDYLRNLDENGDELDVHLMLFPLDKQSTPILQRPYLCCRPTLSVRHLCQYVALQTPMHAEEVEILVVKEPCYKTADECGSMLEPSTSKDHSIPKFLVDPCKDELQILEEQETLAGIQANCTTSQGHLVLVYRQKVSS